MVMIGIKSCWAPARRQVRAMPKSDHVIYCPLCHEAGRRRLKTFNSLRALNIHLTRAHGAQYRYGEFGGTTRRFLGAVRGKTSNQFD